MVLWALGTLLGVKAEEGDRMEKAPWQCPCVPHNPDEEQTCRLFKGCSEHWGGR